MDKEFQNWETFLANVRRSNSNSQSVEITIDSKVVQFMGLEVGDKVKLMIRKVSKQEE